MKRQQIRKALILASFMLFPITIFYLSPYLIIMGAAEGIIAGSFLVFAALFLTAVFFGRLFCSWICPAGGLQEALILAKDKKVSRSKCAWIKYLIWVPWVAFIIFLVWKNGARQVAFFYQTTNGLSLSASEPGTYFVYYAVISLIVILALTVGKKGFCHCVCWMAPFMILGGKIRRLLRIPALHLASSPDRCNNCLICEKQCPMSLDVNKMVQSSSMKNDDCILCGACVDHCPKKAIQFAFGWEKRSARSGAEQKQKAKNLGPDVNAKGRS